MKSYNNDPAFKKKAVEAAIRHRDMDMLMAGTYGKDTVHGFKGCSVGCDAFDITGGIAGDPHQTTGDYFGFPEWLERLRDSIFESLERADRLNWHVDIKQAIPIGMNESDFDQVKKDFLVWLMEQNVKVVEGLDIERALKDQVLSAINGTIEAISTGKGLEAAENSAADARDAFVSAKIDAGSYAINAARVAPLRQVFNASSLTAAAVSDGSAASWSASYKKQAVKLIEIFEAFNK